MTTPRFKVYTEDGEYIAATKDPEDAAMVLAGRGRDGWGMTIRDGHRKKDIVYTLGIDQPHAGESYDNDDELVETVFAEFIGVAQLVWQRVKAMNRPRRSADLRTSPCRQRSGDQAEPVRP
jgi:hypothetical protein